MNGFYPWNLNTQAAPTTKLDANSIEQGMGATAVRKTPALQSRAMASEDPPCCFLPWFHHLHSHQGCRKIPLSVHLLQYLFFVALFNDGHCDQCEVISHWGFDWHWFNNYWCGASFPVLFLLYTLWLQFTSWKWALFGILFQWFHDISWGQVSFTALLDLWLLRALQSLFQSVYIDPNQLVTPCPSAFLFWYPWVSFLSLWGCFSFVKKLICIYV